MRTCRCGLVPMTLASLSAWFGHPHRDGKWHSLAKCGERCDQPDQALPPDEPARCRLVAGHPDLHAFGMDPVVSREPVEPVPFRPESHAFTDGDWVLVYAQVAPMGNGMTPRPEEINVRMESKGSDYHALVRRDWVHSPHTPPPGWPRCTDLLNVGDDDATEVFVRCVLPDDHAGLHRSGRGDQWAEAVSHGYFEENSMRGFS